MKKKPRDITVDQQRKELLTVFGRLMLLNIFVILSLILIIDNTTWRIAGGLTVIYDGMKFWEYTRELQSVIEEERGA